MYGSDDDKKPVAGMSRKASSGGMGDMLKSLAKSIAEKRMAMRDKSKPATRMGKPSGMKNIPLAPRGGKPNLKPIPLAPRKKDR
jgi:hypothetical protein